MVRLSLAARLTLIPIAGMVVLAGVLVALNIYLMHDEADRAARERVDTNMKVAWSVLKQRGEIRVADGKM